LKLIAYGAGFVDQDMSGWDEMYPTINACTYPVSGPYAGAKLPDHGEVWALPWELLRAESGVLELGVNGRALPYRLTRTMSLIDDHTLRLGYEVVNTGSAPFFGLWAAHPQFCVTPHTRIQLPVKQVVNVTDIPEWGTPGQLFDWPETTTQHGERRQIDAVAPTSAHRCRKFYTQPDQPVSWSGLHETPTGPWLRLEWDAAQVPYLGIWVDEGMFNTAPTAALEPATGYYDSLEWAYANQRVPLLNPGQRVAWEIKVQIGQA
jgi:galactose mutarotase-like enzyme